MIANKFGFKKAQQLSLAGESPSGLHWVVEDSLGGKQGPLLKSHEGQSWEWTKAADEPAAKAAPPPAGMPQNEDGDHTVEAYERVKAFMRKYGYGDKKFLLPTCFANAWPDSNPPWPKGSKKLTKYLASIPDLEKSEDDEGNRIIQFVSQESVRPEQPTGPTSSQTAATDGIFRATASGTDSAPPCA